MASYTRSRALSNEALAFSVDQALQVTDNAGPLPWDAPNRLVTWAYLPTRWENWAVAYSMEIHTGFPYSIVNGDGQVVGAVDSQRLPMFLSLNLHPEYKFKLFGRHWAIRAGSITSPITRIRWSHRPSRVSRCASSAAKAGTSWFACAGWEKRADPAVEASAEVPTRHARVD